MPPTGVESEKTLHSGKSDSQGVGAKSGWLRPDSLELPPLLPASFGGSPIGGSVKPPPPPLLPYPPGGLLVPPPRLWSRLLRPDPSGWEPSGRPGMTILSTQQAFWSLPGAAPPLLADGKLNIDHCDPTLPLDNQSPLQPSHPESVHNVRERGLRTTSAAKRRADTDVFAVPDAKRTQITQCAVVFENKRAYLETGRPQVPVQEEKVSQDGLANPREGLTEMSGALLRSINTLHPSGIRASGNKLSQNILGYNCPKSSTMEANVKWFNPQDKDFDFSWGENVSHFKAKILPETYSDTYTYQKRKTCVEATGRSTSTSVAGMPSPMIPSTTQSERAIRRSSVSNVSAPDLSVMTPLTETFEKLDGLDAEATENEKMPSGTSHQAHQKRGPTSTTKFKEVSYVERHASSIEQNHQKDETADTLTRDARAKACTETPHVFSRKSPQADGDERSAHEVKLTGSCEKRRHKNNEAAKRSRDARRAKEDGIAVRCALLEAENVQLRLEMAWLKGETARLKYVLYSS